MVSVVTVVCMPATLTNKLRLSWSVALVSGSESSNAFAHIQTRPSTLGGLEKAGRLSTHRSLDTNLAHTQGMVSAQIYSMHSRPCNKKYSSSHYARIFSSLLLVVDFQRFFE